MLADLLISNSGEYFRERIMVCTGVSTFLTCRSLGGEGAHRTALGSPRARCFLLHDPPNSTEFTGTRKSALKGFWRSRSRACRLFALVNHSRLIVSGRKKT